MANMNMMGGGTRGVMGRARREYGWFLRRTISLTLFLPQFFPSRGRKISPNVVVSAGVVSPSVVRERMERVRDFFTRSFHTEIPVSSATSSLLFHADGLRRHCREWEWECVCPQPIYFGHQFFTFLVCMKLA